MVLEALVHKTPKVKARQNDWWRGAVIYQIYPRSFQDSNGDGIGDLPGIYRRLDHVASLGVDAIWISPFFKSPMKDYGYDVADFTAIDPLFGTLADFDSLLEKAHRLGLKVMIDFVPCHTSNEHAWFLESRESRNNAKADWYVWVDPQPDGTAPNNWLSIFGGQAWEWEPRRGQYYLRNFLREQPALNLYSSELVAALLDAARFWLKRGVDGLRLDAIDYGLYDVELRDNPPRNQPAKENWGGSNPFNMQVPLYNKGRPDLSDIFLKPLYQLTESFGATVLLGEISGDRAPERLAEYTNGGGLDLCYSFDLIHCSPTPQAIREIVEYQEKLMDQGWACWAFSNHDSKRAYSRFAEYWGESEDLGLLLPVLLASLRGTICLYQGEELGLAEADIQHEDMRDPFGLAFWPLFKGRDGCRTPFPWEGEHPSGGFTDGKAWLPLGEGHLARALDQQIGKDNCVYERLRGFLAWRKQKNILLRGDIEFLKNLPEDILGFLRKEGDQQMLCLFNFASSLREVVIPGSIRVSEIYPRKSKSPEHGPIPLKEHGFFFGLLEAGSQIS